MDDSSPNNRARAPMEELHALLDQWQESERQFEAKRREVMEGIDGVLAQIQNMPNRDPRKLVCALDALVLTGQAIKASLSPPTSEESADRERDGRTR